MLLNISEICDILSHLSLKGFNTMENNKRREFLKKVVYKAPAIIALGSLVAPISANASSLHTQAEINKKQNATASKKFGTFE